MKSLTLAFFFALSCALSLNSAWADPIEELLASRTRPTIQQVYQVIEALGFPDQNPFRADGDDDRSQTIRDKLKVVANLISGLEAYYPGGTWAPLGRDVVMLGDAIDSFYLYIGQAGRVSRLNGSGTSIRGQGEDTLFRFAESAGVDLDLLAKGKMAPFVIFDATSFASSSQSYEIINAIWSRALDRGIPAELLPRSIGIFNFSGNEVASENDLEFDKPHPEELFARQSENGTRQSPAPGVLMSTMYDGGALTYGHTSEWHNTFGRMEVQPNGRFEGTPPEFSDSYRQRRLQILADHYEIIRATWTPEFLELVKGFARAKGYEFPVERRFAPIRFKAPPKKGPRELSTELKQILDTVPAGENAEVGKSTGFLALSAWLQKTFPLANSPVNALTLFLRVSTRAYDKDQVGSRDFRRLVAMALERADVNDPVFQRRLATLLESEPSLLSILSKKSKFFLEGSRKFGSSVAEKYEVLRKLELVPVLCEEVLDPAASDSAA